jgi:hypothetical protein
MTPLIGVPAVVLAFLAALGAPSQSLGDVARREAIRRALTPQATHTLTNADLPPPPAAPAPEAAPPAVAETVFTAAPVAKEDTEAWWRDRAASARAAKDRDALLVEALQSRINALTTDVVNRDDPAQRKLLIEERQRALDALGHQQQLVKDDDERLADLQEAARKKGIPPGWIR